MVTLAVLVLVSLAIPAPHQFQSTNGCSEMSPYPDHVLSLTNALTNLGLPVKHMTSSMA